MSYEIDLMKDIKGVLEDTNIEEYADELYEKAVSNGDANLIGDSAILINKITDVIMFLEDMIIDYDYLDDYDDVEDIDADDTNT